LEINSSELQQKIKDAKNEKQAAFNYLLDYFWNQVYAFQLKKTRNEHDAEEITIQTFSKAFDKIETFDENYSFSTWLIAISKNIHIDLIRKRKSSIQSSTTRSQDEQVYRIADDTPSVEDKLITDQHLAQLLIDIKQLSTHYQEVINLRYFQEKSYKEIANSLGEPMSNVKVKLLRAKKLLAHIIRDRKSRG